MTDLHRIAAAYPAEARFTPPAERERYFTPAQEFAWLIRFDPGFLAELPSAADNAEP